MQQKPFIKVPVRLFLLLSEQRYTMGYHLPTATKLQDIQKGKMYGSIIVKIILSIFQLLSISIITTSY